MLYAEQLRQFLFKSFTFGTERQPKIQRRRYGRLHLIFSEDSSRVRDSRLTRDELRAIEVVSRTIRLVHQRRILPRKPKDLRFDFVSFLIHRVQARFFSRALVS